MPTRSVRKTQPVRKARPVRKAPPQPKAAPAPKPSGKETRKARHAGRLKAGLLALRTTLQEVQEHYSVRTNGLLVQMMQVVEPPEGSEHPVLPSRKTVDRMLEAIQGLKVKPKKGRGKDLQRLQDLLEALWIQLPPQP
jgi:hypothetical protein